MDTKVKVEHPARKGTLALIIETHTSSRMTMLGAYAAWTTRELVEVSSVDRTGAVKTFSPIYGGLPRKVSRGAKILIVNGIPAEAARKACADAGNVRGLFDSLDDAKAFLRPLLSTPQTVNA